MNLKETFTGKKILFILLFAVLTFIGYQINFSPIVGVDNQFFTLFQFFGPMAGAFLGPIIGAFSVLIAEIGNYLLLGKAFNLINIIRLTPMLFAAYYFGTHKNKKDFGVVIPILCIAAFILHPVGAQVWFISLYWLIPLIAKFSNRLFIRSLGTTFSAHAIGTTLWIWTVPMTPEAWIALIPVMAFERTVFALGITGSYIGINTILNRFEVAVTNLNIDKRYVLGKNLFRIRA